MKKGKQAGAELGQAQYKIGQLAKLMSSAFCKASIGVDFHQELFHQGRLPLRSSSIEVIFHRGRLVLRLSSIEVGLY